MQKMISRPFSLGSHGLSLVGVMAGVAVGSVVALGIAQIISSTFSGQKLIEYRENVKNIKYEITGILSQRQNCTQSFVNINPITNTQPERTSLQNNGTPNFQVFSGTGPVYSENTVRISRYYFQTGAQSDFVMADPVERKGLVSLYVDFRANNTRLSGVTDITHSIKLSVELNASNQIVSCIAAGNDENSLWKLAGTLGIFYMATPGPTRVGIGTNGPIAALDLHGFLKVEIRPLSSTGGTISAGAELNAPLISAGTIQSSTFRSEQFLHTSDRSLKANILPLNDWRAIFSLRGVQFTWKSQSTVPVFGFIAQDVQNIFPMMVYEDQSSHELAIEEFQLIAPVIEGIKFMNLKQKNMEVRTRKLERSRATRAQPRR